MATSEIEKLERRYAENPHGLTFAPLAEVHRKNGDIPRALELLTAGLELHPNYIPASIVLGRCHQDLDDLPSAEAAFAHVLRLDDENVIALKSLADISERLERHSEAENWLRRLMAVDRSNDDAKEQLLRVQAAKARGSASIPAASAPAEAKEQAKVDAPAPAPALEMIDLAEPAQSAASPPVREAIPPEPAVARKLEPDPLEAEPEPVDAQPEPVDAQPEPVDAEPEPRWVAAEQEPVDAEAEPAEPEPLVVAAAPASPADVPLPFIETSSPGLEAPTSAEAAPEPLVEVPEAEPVQPLPGLISAEFQPPLEATGGLGVETSEEVLLEVSGNSEFSVPDASEDLKSVAARLAAPRPTAPLEEPPLEDVILPPAASPAEPDWIPPEPPRRHYLARETNGQSVAAFFRALLSARLGSSDAAGSSVSGQNGGGSLGYGDEELPAPPAVPAGEQKGEAAPSFDDFFGSKPDPASPSRQGKGDPGEDDLDQFQSWLQNLKR
jgi:hypothetical protein